MSPPKAGFTTIMNEFFNSLQDRLEIGNLSNRSIVRQRGNPRQVFQQHGGAFEKIRTISTNK